MSAKHCRGRARSRPEESQSTEWPAPALTDLLSVLPSVKSGCGAISGEDIVSVGPQSAAPWIVGGRPHSPSPRQYSKKSKTDLGTNAGYQPSFAGPFSTPPAAVNLHHSHKIISLSPKTLTTYAQAHKIYHKNNGWIETISCHKPRRPSLNWWMVKTDKGTQGGPTPGARMEAKSPSISLDAVANLMARENLARKLFKASRLKLTTSKKKKLFMDRGGNGRSDELAENAHTLSPSTKEVHSPGGGAALGSAPSGCIFPKIGHQRTEGPWSLIEEKVAVWGLYAEGISKPLSPPPPLPKGTPPSIPHQFTGRICFEAGRKIMTRPLAALTRPSKSCLRLARSSRFRFPVG